MTTGTFVSWMSLINAIGLGVIAILFPVLEILYIGFYIPSAYMYGVGIAVTAYLAYAETAIGSGVSAIGS